MKPTKEQARAAISLIKTLLESIREAGELPEGSLYAVMSSYNISLDQYEQIVSFMVRTKLVRRSNHVLTWVGPPAE